MKGVTG